MECHGLPFRKMVFVCVNRRDNGEACCAERGSEAILTALKERVKALGLAGKIRVSKSGCQDLCAKGPNVMVFPDNVWYHGVTPADVEPILSDLIRTLDTTPSSTAAATSHPGQI